MSSIRSSSGKSEIADQYATQQAEKEKLRSEHEDEMDRLKQSFQNEQEYTRDRFEKTVQNEKLRSYDNIRDAKRKLTATEREQKKLADNRLQQLSDDYRSEESRINKDGKTKVDEARKKQAVVEEYQRLQAMDADSELKNRFSNNARRIIRDYENKVEDLNQTKQDELVFRNAEHGTALEHIRDHYDHRNQEALTHMENEAKRIESGVDQHIAKSLVANAERVDRNLNRSNDPFYQMARFDSDFSDRGDHYELRVQVPEHERKFLRVQINGLELQLNGTRSNNQSVKLAEGHEVSTKSHQSISERFQFDAPVDSKALTRREDGDWVVFSVPKFGPNHRMRDTRISSTITAKDLEMGRDQDFKETLPRPTFKA